MPAAEPLLSGWRRRHDASAAAGVPAHVTVLAPFLASERITDEVIGELGELLAGQAAPQVRFARTGRFAAAGAVPGVLYLAPEPAGELRELTRTVVARWPETPPYGGLHAEVVPHMTVAIADEATLDRIERELGGGVGRGAGGEAGCEGGALGGALVDGITATLDEAMVYVHAGERWHAVATLPLGDGPI